VQVYHSLPATNQPSLFQYEMSLKEARISKTQKSIGSEPIDFKLFRFSIPTLRAWFNAPFGLPLEALHT